MQSTRPNDPCPQEEKSIKVEKKRWALIRWSGKASWKRQHLSCLYFINNFKYYLNKLKWTLLHEIIQSVVFIYMIKAETPLCLYYKAWKGRGRRVKYMKGICFQVGDDHLFYSHPNPNSHSHFSKQRKRNVWLGSHMPRRKESIHVLKTTNSLPQN